ncbi:hypothetical protein [Novosphingobium sp. PhB165]|uniref:hypothetical protein n=1 Tax=Novosphingobium sp. PhB165 TaxID=2485105 RepID=UPI00104A267D|nr:hypothetical protein [Novosphingobium sp. PhB165]
MGKIERRSYKGRVTLSLQELVAHGSTGDSAHDFPKGDAIEQRFPLVMQIEWDGRILMCAIAARRPQLRADLQNL